MKTESRLLGLMGAFGFLSGLPLSLTAFTLQLWFTTYHLSIHAIGLTSWIGLSYTLKFLWSGLFDRPPPGPLGKLGRRRGWLVIIQPLLALSCAAMAASNPGQGALPTVVAALFLAFFSASQDILIDAWRIETFSQRLQGAALAAYIWGYRGAMITSTSGVLWIASFAGWRAAWLAMTALLACGLFVTLLAPLSVVQPPAPRSDGWRAGVQAAFVAPLADFLRRRGATTVLAFVLLFRLGKVFADGSAAAFYRYGLGFSQSAIASANFYGWAGTLAGAAAGGWLVLRLGTLRALLAAGALQAASLGLYLMLLATGPATTMLTVKLVGENFAGSVADMAFLTYISALCSTRYTASQYALLSSLAAVAFHTLGGLSGYAAEALGFRAFYTATIAASLPALLLVLQMSRSGSEPSRSG